MFIVNIEEVKRMKVSEVAKLIGISVRTLHYYDEIGLLEPDTISENSYRLYSDRNLQGLQQILFFRELGFPLKEIKQILGSSNFDRIEALEMQRKMLQERRKKTDQLIATIDQTIQDEKGEIKMTKAERFKGFNFDHNDYEEEARERWGDDAVDASKGKIKKLNPTELEAQMNECFRTLAAIRHLNPTSEEAQAAIAVWFKELNQIGNYSLEAFQGLGEMYVTDERFTKNIDQFGEGLAQFMCDSMCVYTEKR